MSELNNTNELKEEKIVQKEQRKRNNYRKRYQKNKNEVIKEEQKENIENVEVKNKKRNKTNETIANKKVKEEFKFKSSPVKIIPLGGLLEVGKNITVFEYENEMIVVDCGLAFPEEDMLGVDLVISIDV